MTATAKSPARPPFLSFLAVAWMASGALTILNALLLLLAGMARPMGEGFVALGEETPGIATVLGQLGPLGVMVFFWLGGLLQGVLGFGLWRLCNGARVGALLYLGLLALLFFAGFVLAWGARDTLSAALNALLAALLGVLGWYLLTPALKRAFGVREPPR
ncbi:MAG: hypothetical protein ACE5HB_02520 [Terriglobia bacterium]